jgi:hypothetical protein
VVENRISGLPRIERIDPGDSEILFFLSRLPRMRFVPGERREGVDLLSVRSTIL